jgi:hypothetical protein
MSRSTTYTFHDLGCKQSVLTTPKVSALLSAFPAVHSDICLAFPLQSGTHYVYMHRCWPLPTTHPQAKAEPAVWTHNNRRFAKPDLPRPKKQLSHNIQHQKVANICTSAQRLIRIGVAAGILCRGLLNISAVHVAQLFLLVWTNLVLPHCLLVLVWTNRVLSQRLVRYVTKPLGSCADVC